ncbi:hypothetical protein E4U56_007137, partial [Claviceps arundinis]
MKRKRERTPQSAMKPDPATKRDSAINRKFNESPTKEPSRPEQNYSPSKFLQQ